MTLPPFEKIDTESAWRRCRAVLRDQPRAAIDLEANSLYAYRERVCLLQISIPGHDFIIDPLAGFPLDGLQELLADAGIEKVFHASDYDLMLLKREFGWEVCNLFDTMWAARILGYSNMGLAWFMQAFYGVTLSKRYQKTNWAKRPLSQAQLEYAQKDTHYLLQLRDDLAAELEGARRMQEALEIFANACRFAMPATRRFDPDSFWTLRGARDLKPRAQAILKALYVFREQEAQRRDLPVFKVLGNEVLLLLAERAPKTPEALSSSGLSGKQTARLGARLLQVIEEGRHAPLPHLPVRRKRSAPGVSSRSERLLQWRKEQAQQRGVESDVILTRETVWEIARSNPQTLEELAQISTLGPQRLAMYGKNILDEIL